MVALTTLFQLLTLLVTLKQLMLKHGFLFTLNVSFIHSGLYSNVGHNRA